MNLSPSPSRGLTPLRLYNFLSQVGSSRAFGAQKLPGAPSATPPQRQPEIATNLNTTRMSGDCIAEENCYNTSNWFNPCRLGSYNRTPLIFPSLESNAKQAGVLSARVPYTDAIACCLSLPRDYWWHR
ncbi:hypothetical protein PENNAL_c0118G02539 [Penicillium nalgiovense]|uniref:Uncharacterized protein n=1 Tax=Penicillium nalgiovense TaxID=60175 RepID=A0A1V6X5L9_PENNA|nr:hypothetical protein PENNAL_c0118G02539 [Penicillium nalgiovense]